MNREETRQKLIELIEPLIIEEGYELVHLQYVAGRKGQLTILVDHDKGISVEDCVRVSRFVSDLLDHEDPIPGSYTLEVSSPGPERPLTKKEHYIRFEGERVRVQVSKEMEGRKKFSGILKKANKNMIVIELADKSQVEIPYDIIEKANLRYNKPQ